MPRWMEGDGCTARGAEGILAKVVAPGAAKYEHISCIPAWLRVAGEGPAASGGAARVFREGG